MLEIYECLYSDNSTDLFEHRTTGTLTCTLAKISNPALFWCPLSEGGEPKIIKFAEILRAQVLKYAEILNQKPIRCFLKTGVYETLFLRSHERKIFPRGSAKFLSWGRKYVENWCAEWGWWKHQNYRIVFDKSFHPPSVRPMQIILASLCEQSRPR